MKRSEPVELMNMCVLRRGSKVFFRIANSGKLAEPHFSVLLFVIGSL